ncbi:translation initiation factor IF-2 [Triticum aestivum]|uniref:translation initiation factor IF-2 n=1 Tax=Triticum aestivum TaxID=4565 RepID=UPI001D005885|nr:translation initiation factor IF-2-like [Triticum aestivum]
MSVSKIVLYYRWSPPLPWRSRGRPWEGTLAPPPPSLRPIPPPSPPPVASPAKGRVAQAAAGRLSPSRGWLASRGGLPCSVASGAGVPLLRPPSSAPLPGGQPASPPLLLPLDLGSWGSGGPGRAGGGSGAPYPDPAGGGGWRLQGRPAAPFRWWCCSRGSSSLVGWLGSGWTWPGHGDAGGVVRAAVLLLDPAGSVVGGWPAVRGTGGACPAAPALGARRATRVGQRPGVAAAPVVGDDMGRSRWPTGVVAASRWLDGSVRGNGRLLWRRFVCVRAASSFTPSPRHPGATPIIGLVLSQLRSTAHLALVAAGQSSSRARCSRTELVSRTM